MFDLESITDPSFIKKLSIKELNELAKDIRLFLIDNISKTGGHLSSNLGVVEITIAMYYVFDPEKDKFLFDVGHQSYVHKILTGRAKDFKTLRQYGGMSGYISKTESKYDIWESGHSSTSISAMAGMLVNDNESDRIITVIGDSSITNGIALEGLNYIGEKKDKRAIIILNDNKMGISKSVGAFSKMFSRMRGTRFYRGFKAFLIHILPRIIVRIFHRLKRSFKALIQHDNMFEDMGYDYYGPYDGNNIKTLIKLFERIKTHTDSPVVLHLNTIKGKGYKISEEDKNGDFHGVPPFDPLTGEPLKKPQGISYSEAVSNYLIEKRKNNEFVVITPAMLAGSKLLKFQTEYSKDIFDVGIAEEHAAVMGAGVALNNKRVVLLMYSTFAQRAFDEFLNDIARQDLPVIIGIDRAGIVGEDGATHQGIYDVAMFSLMPNFIITMPRNQQELIGLFNYAFTEKHPIVIRYPRQRELESNIDYNYVSNLNWELLNNGTKLNILGYGTDIERISKLVKDNNLDSNVYDCKSIKPMDLNALDSIFNNGLPIIVFEQAVSSGTLYHKILEYKEEKNYKSKVYKHSFDTNTLIPHGSMKDVYEHFGLSDDDLLKAIKDLL